MYTFHFVHKSVIVTFKVFIKNQPVDSYLEHLLQEFHSYDIQKLQTLYIEWTPIPFWRHQTLLQLEHGWTN